MTKLGIIATVGLLCAGCTVVVEPPKGPPPPQGPPAEVPKGVVNGVPEVKPGSGVGVFIWRATDGKWTVRSVTEGKTHKFRGSIRAAKSSISWMEPDMSELGDLWGFRGQALTFLFATGGHLDGLRFVPDDHGCVTFHITVDERPEPNLIFLGSQRMRPPSNHFTACP